MAFAGCRPRLGWPAAGLRLGEGSPRWDNLCPPSRNPFRRVPLARALTCQCSSRQFMNATKSHWRPKAAASGTLQEFRRVRRDARFVELPSTRAIPTRRVPTSIGWPVAGAALGEAPEGAQGISLRCYIEQVIRRSDSKPGAHETGASFANPQSSRRPPGAEVGGYLIPNY